MGSRRSLVHRTQRTKRVERLKVERRKRKSRPSRRRGRAKRTTRPGKTRQRSHHRREGLASQRKEISRWPSCFFVPHRRSYTHSDLLRYPPLLRLLFVPSDLPLVLFRNPILSFSLIDPSLERNMIAPPLHLPRSNFNSVSHRYLLDIPSALSTAPANPSTSPNRTLFNPRSPSSLPPLTHAFLDNGRTLICVHPLNNLSTFSSGVGSEEEEEEEGGVRQRTQIAS